MFRRFMIVCWVLFSIGAATVLVGSAGYEHYGNKAKSFAEANNLGPITATGSEALRERMTPQRLELGRLRNARRDFRDIGHVGAISAGLVLIWNILCHTGHWLWLGSNVSERQSINKVKKNWRAFLVLAAVVWAVVVYAPAMDDLDYALPAILGPFIIATAIYLLFPKAK